MGKQSHTYLYYGTKLMQYGKTDCYDLYFFYDDNGQPLGFYYRDVFTSGRGRKFYFVLNAQGDVVQLRDSQNRTVANYHYDAWGKLLSITDPDGTVLTASSDDYYPTNAQIAFINPIRYRGYVYDNETGFYYLNTRYYDPSLRRFISADGYISTGQGLSGYNMFTYCGNNPVNTTDPSGQFWRAAITNAKKIFGKFLNGLFQVTTIVLPSNAVFPAAPVAPLAPLPTPKPLPPIPEPPLTKEEEKIFASTVYAEAGGENDISKRAVAHVIKNRVDNASTTYEAVVSAPGQFTSYQNTRFNNAMDFYSGEKIDISNVEITAMNSCLSIVLPIYYNQEIDFTGGAIYFHSCSRPELWPYHNSFELLDIPGVEKFWFYR